MFKKSLLAIVTVCTISVFEYSCASENWDAETMAWSTTSLEDELSNIRSDFCDLLSQIFEVDNLNNTNNYTVNYNPLSDEQISLLIAFCRTLRTYKIAPSLWITGFINEYVLRTHIGLDSNVENRLSEVLKTVRNI